MKRTLALSVLFLLLASVAVAGTVDLPKTGQTKCYDTSGAEIPCAETGQDGDIQAGVPWPEPRFTDNGDGTMMDNLTGLMWTKNANLPNGYRKWPEALDYVASLNTSHYLGYSDWRLPNVNELESLVNSGEDNSADWLSAQGFTNVHASFYWSSTSYAFGTDYAWIVTMWDGHLGVLNKFYDAYYVWPVRAGQCGQSGDSVICLPKTGQTTSYAAGDDGDLKMGVAWPHPRFTGNGDNLTGLMWTKNANLLNGFRTWQEALDYVASLNASHYLGYSDWRLPNRKELFSLIDYSQCDPVLPVYHPFTNVQAYSYWSSTSYAFVTDYAWIVSMWDGYVGNHSKSDSSYYVWPVRGGQGGPLDHWTISGTVTGAVQQGVTMTLSGTSSATSTTDGSGNYSFSELSNGSYTVTPTLTGYTFSPPSSPVEISGADETGVNFTASASSCAAEALLGKGEKAKVYESESTLGVLRNFRDNTLSRTEEGEELIKLYYQHSPEIINIMAANPMLAGKTLLMLLNNIAALDATTKNGHEMTISKKTFVEATQLLNDYESYASAELMDALEKVKAFVEGRRKAIWAGRVKIEFSE